MKIIVYGMPWAGPNFDVKGLLEKAFPGRCTFIPGENKIADHIGIDITHEELGKFIASTEYHIMITPTKATGYDKMMAFDTRLFRQR